MKKMNRILNILLICGLGILLFLSIGVIATRAMAAESETSPCYTVSVADADHGIIALDEDVSLIPGEQIHLQITAEEGYQLAALDVRDASDSPLDLIDQDGNKITPAEYPDQVYFEMPESNVTVMAQFVSETVNENDSEENTDDVLSMIGADIPLAVSMNGEERMMARAAASGTLNKAQNLFACYHKDGSFDCTESLLTLNNQWVWCIEPSINIGSAGGNYTLGYNGNAAQWLKDKYGWSYSKTNNLTKAVYLAKNYFGSDGYCNYVLVQDLIWSEIKESESARDAGRYVLTDGAHKTTHKCGHLDSKAKVDAAIADIWSKFFNYNKLPSFNGWTVYATAGQSYWLKDTNNVVGDTSFINPSNVEVTRGWDGSNNGIWIKSNANMAGKSININYYKNAIPNSSEPVLIYIRSGYQAVSAWNNAITPTYGSIRVVFSRTSYLKAHYKARTAVYPSMKLDTIKISDILVINQNGEVSTYYTDADGPHKIFGFFNLVSDGAVIAADTKDYQIEGYEGSWMVTDFLIMDGKQFYLMEHQRFHDQANKVILDSYGKLVTETGKAGFDEIAKQKIRDYGKEKKNQEPVKEDHQERIEHYQKMILQKKDARISGGMSINEQDQKSSESELEIPGKKKSIVGRLRRHQAEIAAKEGKPVSKYLEMQLAREKKN